jgi:hypothetical protein
VNNAFIVDESSDGCIASQARARGAGHPYLSNRTWASHSSPKVAFDPLFHSSLTACQENEQAGLEYPKLPEVFCNAANSVLRFDGATAILGAWSSSIIRLERLVHIRLAKDSECRRRRSNNSRTN